MITQQRQLGDVVCLFTDSTTGLSMIKRMERAYDTLTTAGNDLSKFDSEYRTIVAERDRLVAEQKKLWFKSFDEMYCVLRELGKQAQDLTNRLQGIAGQEGAEDQDMRSMSQKAADKAGSVFDSIATGFKVILWAGVAGVTAYGGYRGYKFYKARKG